MARFDRVYKELPLLPAPVCYQGERIAILDTYENRVSWGIRQAAQDPDAYEPGVEVHWVKELPQQ